MRVVSAFALFLLTACEPKDAETCDVSVAGTFPVAGTLASYRDSFGFILSMPDPTATIETDVPGHLVTSADGLSLRWVPDAPLTPLTDYSATLVWCGGKRTMDFTTSDLGLPMDDPQVLVGRVFEVNLPEANIAEPPGLGGLLGPKLAVVLAEIGAVSETSLDVLGAVAVEDSQPPVEDYCTPTIPFPPGDFAEQPFFHLGPTDVDLVVGGIIVTVDDLELTGTFSSDGTYFGGGTFRGIIDTRPLSLVDNPDGDGTDYCVALSGLGVECDPCPADSQPYCLTVLADGILAEQRSDVDVIEITGYNCEGCQSGPPEPDAVCEG